MSNGQIPSIKLSSGFMMPIVGLGVYKVLGDDAYNAVRWALEAGYRHIDTAAYYQNEKEVGRAIKDSKIAREEIFVTTKLWNDDITAGRAKQALEASLQNLGVSYIDLYLLHWPVPGWEKAYQDLEAEVAKGLIKSLGVSNFLVHHLEKLLTIAKIKPAVDQVECHPTFQVNDLYEYTKANNIALEAWRPIGGNATSKDLTNDTVMAIAKTHNVSPVQVALKWNVQRGVIVIPKSVHKERIVSNADLFGFTLTDEEMRAMAKLDDPNGRLGKNPADYDV